MSEHGTSPQGRIPPHDQEAERAVLGALLLAPDRAPDVAETLCAEDFYSRRHRVLFDTILALCERNITIDILSVLHRRSNRLL